MLIPFDKAGDQRAASSPAKVTPLLAHCSQVRDISCSMFVFRTCRSNVIDAQESDCPVRCTDGSPFAQEKNRVAIYTRQQIHEFAVSSVVPSTASRSAQIRPTARSPRWIDPDTMVDFSGKRYSQTSGGRSIAVSLSTNLILGQEIRHRDPVQDAFVASAAAACVQNRMNVQMGKSHLEVLALITRPKKGFRARQAACSCRSRGI